MRGIWRRHAQLHPQEAVPASQREPAAEARRVREVELAVDGDRVVQRRGDRPAVLHHPEHAGAEALVVVDEVEVVAAGLRSRRARWLNVYGSGKPAAHMMPNSRTSMRVLELAHGAAPGTGRASGRGRGSAPRRAARGRRARGHGWPDEHLDLVARAPRPRGRRSGCRRPGRRSAGCRGRRARRCAAARRRTAGRTGRRARREPTPRGVGRRARAASHPLPSGEQTPGRAPRGGRLLTARRRMRAGRLSLAGTSRV